MRKPPKTLRTWKARLNNWIAAVSAAEKNSRGDAEERRMFAKFENLCDLCVLCGLKILRRTLSATRYSFLLRHRLLAGRWTRRRLGAPHSPIIANYFATLTPACDAGARTISQKSPSNLTSQGFLSYRQPDSNPLGMSASAATTLFRPPVGMRNVRLSVVEKL